MVLSLSYQFSSVPASCPTPCDPMDCIVTYSWHYFLLAHLCTYIIQLKTNCPKQGLPTKSWLLSCRRTCPSAGAGCVLGESWSTRTEASFMFLSTLTWCHWLSLKWVGDCTEISKGPFPTSNENVTTAGAEGSDMKIAHVSAHGGGSVFNTLGKSPIASTLTKHEDNGLCSMEETKDVGAE